MDTKIDAKSQNRFLTVILLTALTACGNMGPDLGLSAGSGGDNGEFSGESLEGGAVQEIEFDEGENSTVINFGEVSPTERYVVSIYHYSEAGDAQSFQLASINEEDTSDSAASVLALSSLQSDKPTEDFHQWLRGEEENLDSSAALNRQKPSAFKAVTSTTEPALGSTRKFKVLNSFGGGSYETVTAVLRYKTGDFLVYIDQRNEESLSDSEMDDLIGPFSELIDEERDLFGSESDVDGDGRFNILLTEVVNRLGALGGGLITGYFYAVDLFSTDTYPQSNETEIFYTFVPDPDGEFGARVSKSFALNNILPSVMPHEFQHMINFNMHYFVNDGQSEWSWLNEGLSHLAEDIYSLNTDGFMEETGVENPARVAGYLNDIDNLSFSAGSSLYQRGGSYLFLRYLYEQAEKKQLDGAQSGREFIGLLLDTELTGTENVVAAAYGEGVPVEGAFRSLLGRFGLAIFMSGTGLTSDSRLNIDGIDLRGSQNDNRGTYLDGPVIRSTSSFPLSDSIAEGSVTYVGLTADEINNLGGEVKVTVDDAASSGVYLIQTGI